MSKDVFLIVISVKMYLNAETQLNLDIAGDEGHFPVLGCILIQPAQKDLNDFRNRGHGSGDLGFTPFEENVQKNDPIVETVAGNSALYQTLQPVAKNFLWWVAGEAALKK